MQDKSAEILDLDSKETWHSDFFELINNQWNQVSKDMHEEGKARDFIFKLRHASGFLQNPKIKSLFEMGMEIISKNYSHVIGFHLCRIENPESYNQKGLLVPDFSETVNVFKKMFPGAKNVEVELRKLDEEKYLKHNEGTVFFYISRLGIRDSSYNFSYGGELFGILADRFDKKARDKIDQKGKRSLIKFKISLSWNDVARIYDIRSIYVSHVLAEIVRSKRFPTEEYDGFNQGYSVKRNIPPET